MILLIALICINLVHCYDVESYEVNRIENDYSPFYDMVVYSDIVDILNEFDTKGGHPLEAIIRSGSDSDENVEDLLSEYQRHIDKIAHDVEQLKKRTPPIRREYYSTDFYNPMKLPHQLNPLTPPNAWTGFKPDAWKLDLANNDDIINSIYSTNDLSTRSQKTIFDQSCFCKNNRLPCECDCKLCIMPLDMLHQNPKENRNQDNRQTENLMPLYNLYPDSPSKDMNIDRSRPGDNTLNIKIKFEIQMPETSITKGKHCRNHTKFSGATLPEATSVEITPRTVSVPSSYMQYPLPLDMLGLNKNTKINRPQSIGVQKMSIHKRKKSKPNNNIKKHRKKVVTFHDIKFDAPQRIIHSLIKPERQIFNLSKVQYNNDVDLQTTSTQETVSTTESTKEEKITVTLNLISGKENATDEIKLENHIIDDDAELPKLNATEEKVVRRKRDVGMSNKDQEDNTTSHAEQLFIKLKGLKIIARDVTKKVELKNLFPDSELLYWPSNNKLKSSAASKNITTLIMERENRKAKVNISKDVIRNNHTKALEKAIFGNVDWDDMDAVTPMFLSFVGKYLRGVLTFCSDQVCHSMKCAEKVCLHRTCKPEDRLNRKGHCAVANTTDSVASMESIMDLPSNVAFEIVDILQENMTGKIYGKGTLCISNKCISFVAAKKMFSKSRCSIKDLNTLGHCSNLKYFKSL